MHGTARRPYPFIFVGVERLFSDKTLISRKGFFRHIWKKKRVKSCDESIEEKKSIDNKIVKITNVKETTIVMNLKKKIMIE